ncbi:hypothetical protein GIB67_038277 [Kingdonia uniflora]|uniref:F-box domain-containing protein n=1 Tax=Kingdonia uniflora TaxID=39325 RepID=A0A7J7MS93_9MAGN|nr:hypothetical protein GIB67_038277 [Kingdonia uniflora]
MGKRKSIMEEKETALKGGVVKLETRKRKNRNDDTNFSHVFSSRSNLDFKGKKNSMDKGSILKKHRNVQGSGKSVSPMDCDDILILILLRLSWRSVIRFMSVSKRWHRIISDPIMLSKHQSRNCFVLGFHWGGHSSSHPNFCFIPFDMNRAYNLSGRGNLDVIISTRFRLKNLESSNGLVLVSYLNGYPNEHVRENEEEIYCVFNPAPAVTRIDNVVLPLFSDSTEKSKSFTVEGIAFDPSRNPPYLVVTKMYDVQQGLKVISFSSKTKRWSSKVHDVEPFMGADYKLSGPSTFYKGVLHWLFDPSGLVAYDLKSESFSLMKVPGDRDDGYCFCKELAGRPYCICRSLAESRGCLAYSRVVKDNELSVWVLVDYYRSEWAKSYNICINISPPMSLAYGKLICFNPQDSRDVFIKIQNCIYICGVDTGELKVFHEALIQDDAVNRVSHLELYVEPPLDVNICLAKISRGFYPDTCPSYRGNQLIDSSKEGLCDMHALPMGKRKCNAEEKATLQAGVVKLEKRKWNKIKDDPVFSGFLSFRSDLNVFEC